ncbi:hypothetical protein BBP40_001030 [Aspergillus hancockii]|nr:hypothetical protein BBP40_001030 [Aspergillus hancockii]
MTYTKLLPSGVSWPLAEDNEHNHGGRAIIVASVCLFLVLVSLGMRLYAASTRKSILRDDCLFALTVMAAVAQISTVLSQAHFGWGKSSELLDFNDPSSMKKNAYGSDLLYVVVLGLSKGCTVLLYRHFSSRVFHWMTSGMLSATIIWTLVALLLLAIRCSHSPWEDIEY